MRSISCGFDEERPRRWCHTSKLTKLKAWWQRQAAIASWHRCVLPLVTAIWRTFFSPLFRQGEKEWGNWLCESGGTWMQHCSCMLFSSHSFSLSYLFLVHTCWMVGCWHKMGRNLVMGLDVVIEIAHEFRCRFIFVGNHEYYAIIHVLLQYTCILEDGYLLWSKMYSLELI